MIVLFFIPPIDHNPHVCILSYISSVRFASHNGCRPFFTMPNAIQSAFKTRWECVPHEFTCTEYAFCWMPYCVFGLLSRSLHYCIISNKKKTKRIISKKKHHTKNRISNIHVQYAYQGPVLGNMLDSVIWFFLEFRYLFSSYHASPLHPITHEPRLQVALFQQIMQSFSRWF